MRSFKIRPVIEAPLTAEWNYQELPEDHPERQRIEAMFAGIKPTGKKRSIPTIEDETFVRRKEA